MIAQIVSLTTAPLPYITLYKDKKQQIWVKEKEVKKYEINK
jgi:hypothetical protein